MADQREADQSRQQPPCRVHDQWLIPNSPESPKKPVWSDLISAFVRDSLLHECTLDIHNGLSAYYYNRSFSHSLQTTVLLSHHGVCFHASDFDDFVHSVWNFSSVFSKPYTMKDFTNLRQELKLGGLGPTNTIPEAVVNTHFRLNKDLSIWQYW